MYKKKEKKQTQKTTPPQKKKTPQKTIKLQSNPPKNSINQ